MLRIKKKIKTKQKLSIIGVPCNISEHSIPISKIKIILRIKYKRIKQNKNSQL